MMSEPGAVPGAWCIISQYRSVSCSQELNILNPEFPMCSSSLEAQGNVICLLAVGRQPRPGAGWWLHPQPTAMPALRQQEAFGEGVACADEELVEKEKQFRQFSKHQIQLEDNCSTPQSSAPLPTTGWPPSWPRDLPVERQRGMRSSHHLNAPGAVGTVHKVPKLSLGYFTSSFLLGSCALAFSAGRKGEGPPCPEEQDKPSPGGWCGSLATSRAQFLPYIS